MYYFAEQLVYLNKFSLVHYCTILALTENSKCNAKCDQCELCDTFMEVVRFK